MDLQNNLNKILDHLGINPIMTERPSPKDYEYYVSDEYRHSIRWETDEAYRMFEYNLIHLDSGLRLVMTSHEDYFDNVTYKIIWLYIILNDGKKLEILDVDFDNKIFITGSCEIPFTDASRKTY